MAKNVGNIQNKWNVKNNDHSKPNPNPNPNPNYKYNFNINYK